MNEGEISRSAALVFLGLAGALGAGFVAGLVFMENTPEPLHSNLRQYRGTPAVQEQYNPDALRPPMREAPRRSPPPPPAPAPVPAPALRPTTNPG